MKYKFPKDFLWGVATSGYQTEGNGANTDWWYQETHKKATDKYPEEPSGVANDFWNRYEEDIDLVTELNCNSYRMSVEWSRIEPREGQFDEEAIFHYKKILQYAKSKNLKIFLTIHHFTIPLWFMEKGGFENFLASKYFSRYAFTVVQEFKDYADFFITINEIEVLTLMGYMRGSWAPMKKNSLLAIWVHINLLRCHNQAYIKIKKSFSVKVGLVKNIVWYEGKGDSILDKINARLAFYVNNHLSMMAVAKNLDFIGLNYYFSNLIKNFIVCNPCDPESDLGWWISFDGLRNTLVSLRRYNKDIYITENGLADANDEKRKWFIKNMLISAHEALDANEVNLKGYFHWTLTDNFEWHHGYWPQFGLVKIDRKNNLQRIKRPSFDYYKMICKTGIVEDTIN